MSRIYLAPDDREAMGSARRRWFAILASIAFASLIFAGLLIGESPHSWPEHAFERGPARENMAMAKILRNIASAAGAADGLVIASPSRADPDYYYTWTRDSALTMKTVGAFLLDNRSIPAGSPLGNGVLIEPLIRDYVSSQLVIQQRDNPSGGFLSGGLGEPKFEVDGTPFEGSWGRPQRDGPPLRALATIPYAHFLLDRGWPADIAYVAEHLYDSSQIRSAHSLIKNDLEYTAHRWQQRPLGFDLWEETQGTHFFTLMASRKALMQGADLAARLQDPGAAAYYHLETERINDVLHEFWDEAGYLRATLEDIPGSIPGNASKAAVRSSLDCAVPLALIHAGDDVAAGTNCTADSDEVLATVRRYALSFANLYNINESRGHKWAGGWALGRYAEDVYDGIGKSLANPWYLCTFAVAHVLLLAARDIEARGSLVITHKSQAFWEDILNIHYRLGLRQWASPCAAARPGTTLSKHEGDGCFDFALGNLRIVADRYQQVERFAGKELSMSEQINRTSGDNTGAHDLTWSYASYVDLLALRRHLNTG